MILEYSVVRLLQNKWFGNVNILISIEIID